RVASTGRAARRALYSAADARRRRTRGRKSRTKASAGRRSSSPLFRGLGASGSGPLRTRTGKRRTSPGPSPSSGPFLVCVRGGLTSAHQYRTRRVPDDALGVASQELVPQAVVAPGGHDNEVRPLLPGDLDDPARDRAGVEADLEGQVPEVRGAERADL